MIYFNQIFFYREEAAHLASIQALYQGACDESQLSSSTSETISGGSTAVNSAISGQAPTGTGYGKPDQTGNAENSSTIDSPRRRRTGLHTVMEKPPEINAELVQEVECRMRAQQQPTPGATGGANPSAPGPGGQPSKTPSPNKHGSLRARRTGLSTVMEVKSSHADSLNPPLDRISPLLRRSSDCNSSADMSPCDMGKLHTLIKALERLLGWI